MGNKEEKNEDVVTTETEVTELEAEESNMLIKFRNPYVFEGTTYNELDLTPLQNMTAEDMIAVNKRMSKGVFDADAQPELTLEYALLMASRATKLPIEFFYRLPAKEAIKVKNRVVIFFFG